VGAARRVVVKEGEWGQKLKGRISGKNIFGPISTTT
jgi:hypothetical protein